MNMTIVVMILVSIGFLGIGLFILNNKYIKNIDLDDDFAVKEMNAMKLTGKVNIVNGTVGIVISILCLLKSEWMKQLLIIFAICIIVLSLIQYVLSRRIRK